MNRKSLFVMFIWFCFTFASDTEAQQPTIRMLTRQKASQTQQRNKQPPQPIKSVTNGTYKVEVTKVEKTRTILGNMEPRTPGAVFLMVNIKTDDPCFDADKNQSCFDPKITPLTKVNMACGEIETAAGKIYEADGGGLIDGKLACGFVVPSETAGIVKLRLRGYPELKLDIKSEGLLNKGPVTKYDPSKPSVRLIYVSRREADAMKIAERLRRLAVNVTFLETDERGVSDHVGRLYYYPDAENLAKEMARAISDIEKVTPTKIDSKGEEVAKLIIWIVR